MATSEFPTFPRLPAEIRLMIWEAALPDPIGKPLFFWRRTTWRRESDPECLIDADDDLMHPDDMGHFRIAIPLLQVNQEAKRVAEDWIRDDTVFCFDDQFTDFMEEVDALYYVMLPQQMLENHLDWVQQIFLRGLQAWCWDFFIVVGAPAELQQMVPGPPDQVDWQVEQKWELQVLEDLPWAFWIDGGGWRVGEGSSRGETAYERAKELLVEITKNPFPLSDLEAWITWGLMKDFHIRFVSAVRK
ncbi:2EXR domain-containing protein [Aspergillus brunneoviolaceus CBS 621.78]|uniref:Uncharacterized protein n=1 Tax=Aspergillus brunneoviolaceus CBS 621.78 TaxID=1450534 RepID=A0ACD1G7J7_9EURO|nr:hypothetical protein BO95DRAFT_464065 [Aspergillus brunneoviolaceus CBS 621.78]RAH45252.1 hypothetical protein BO95DRAFT_464065 [Aspergillus brunneoviolaceus CBS 621.78]